MDYENISRVEETSDIKEVKKFVEKNGWKILCIAPGQDENGMPLNLYSLGWSKPECNSAGDS